MPSLTEIWKFLSSLTIAEIMVGLAFTSGVMVLLADWRLSLFALAAQYLLITLLLSTIVQLEVALVRLIAGGLVALILFITAQSVRQRWVARAQAAGWRNAGEIATLFEREPFIIGLSFRLFALVLVAVGAYSISSQFNFLSAPPQFWLISLWLLFVGFLLIAISRDALKVGLGLLNFSSGFGLLYLALDPSLLFYGLVLIVDLIIALAVAHLASAPVRLERGARRRGES